MTLYEKVCAERCEWCRDGFRRESILESEDNYMGHVVAPCDCVASLGPSLREGLTSVRCTAPTRDEFEREQQDKIDSLTESVKQGPRLLTWDIESETVVVQEAEDYDSLRTKVGEQAARIADLVSEPYFIEVYCNGCSKCGYGRSWNVIGPDGDMVGKSFESEEDAEDLADVCNDAYHAGCGAATATDPLPALRALKSNWNSYGAPPPTAEALATAEVMLTVPSVVPTSEGGIQLEWHRAERDIEVVILPDGSVEDGDGDPLPALREAVIAAARKLAMRLREVYADPVYQSVWMVNQLHMGPYNGPQWADEQERADAALAALDAAGKESHAKD